MALPPAVQDGIDALRDNRVSGAAQIAAEAAAVVVLAAELVPDWLPEIARLLVAAQPAMAPLVNLSRAVLAASDPGAAARDFLLRMRSAGPRVARHAAGLVRDGSTVLTHSFSSTVFEALQAAHSSGCRFRVLCSESLPMREGAALAASLERETIAGTVIPDAAVESFLPQAGLVLVGADSVSARGLVNKTGTALIARAACALQIPVYGLCTSDKILPPDYDPPRPCEGFDLTPLHFLAGIVTEDGITSPPS